MTRLLMILGVVLTASVCLAENADGKSERLSLWNGKAPNGDGTMEDGDAWLTLHRPEKPNGTAIVICPGGGYGGLVTGAEGHGIAAWLNQHGITGLVLEYRLPKGRPYVPLLDAQRAIQTTRANAQKWDIDAKKIGIMGFSAGGHLASTAATHFDAGVAQSADPVRQQSSRPDFAILIYPVVTMDSTTHGGSRRNLLGDKPSDELIDLFSNEKRVTAETPPTFLAHAQDDKVVVPANSQAFYDALKAHNVPTEYLKLPSGGHGLNGYKGPMWDAWQKQSLEWLTTLKLTSAP
ncbi:prolyl oligopeptidase family serine peptidase [bacterium]|nr:prolyl oligopeptidase family serine peptidase [bacterium]